MEAVWLFLALLAGFILLVVLLLACFPRARNCFKQKHQFYERPRVFATTARLALPGTAVVLPEVPIPADVATQIVFNLPDSGVNFIVPKSGNYSVSYGLQLGWRQEATAVCAISTIVQQGAPAVIIGNSGQKLTIAIASVQNLTHEFIAYLKEGTELYLSCKATVADAVYVPSSTSDAGLLTSTVLAALTIEEV